MTPNPYEIRNVYTRVPDASTITALIERTDRQAADIRNLRNQCSLLIAWAFLLLAWVAVLTVTP